MDETFSLDSLKKGLESMGEQGAAVFEKLKAKAGDASNGFLKWSEVVGVAGPKVADSLHKALESAQELISSFFTLSEVGQKTMEGMAEVGNSVKEMFADSDVGINTIMMGLMDTTGLIDKNITGMGKLGDSGYEAGAKISTAFKSISPIIDAAFKDHPGIIKFTSAVVEGTSRVVGLEREILNMATAQGTASKYFNEADHSVQGLTEAYKDYVEMSVSVARATGQTVGSAMDLNKALAPIPGALDSGENAVKTSRLAAASGREQLEVAKQMGEMYTRLGTSVKDATEAIAYMQDKGGDSKLRMEAFNQTVMTIAGSFKMLGDNTFATTNFVKSFDKAFEQSKISPEAMKEVITSIGEGISHMDVAKKAFISGATGGPGGLAGAVQMDYAIQTGHADEVIRKTMLAMQSQFGGQVVTLKDAAQNPSLAGEFYKQIQYLTQVAGIAKDEDQAKRILEAMKSGVTDILKPGAAEGEKDLSLSRQLDKGASIQARSQNTLMSIHQTLEEARLKQDAFYNNQFANVERSLEGMAMKMGIGFEGIPQEVSGSGKSGRASSTGMSAQAGNSSYQEPRWAEIGGHDVSLSNTITNAKLALGKLLGPTIGHRPPPKEEKIQAPNLIQEAAKHREIADHHIGRQRPGTETGISEISPGHMPKVGYPDIPPLALPTTKIGSADVVKALEVKPQDVNVTVTLKTDDNFQHLIRAEIRRDDMKEKERRIHGRM